VSKHRNRVFIVDDDVSILKGMERSLRQHGYESVLFPSAESFEKHRDFENAVCVIFDINLNGRSGIELRNRLKSAGVSVGVIFITGNHDPAVRDAALESGCVAFLIKPFPVKSLIEPVERAKAATAFGPLGGETDWP